MRLTEREELERMAKVRVTLKLWTAGIQVPLFGIPDCSSCWHSREGLSPQPDPTIHLALEGGNAPSTMPVYVHNCLVLCCCYFRVWLTPGCLMPGNVNAWIHEVLRTLPSVYNFSLTLHLAESFIPCLEFQSSAWDESCYPVPLPVSCLASVFAKPLTFASQFLDD